MIITGAKCDKQRNVVGSIRHTLGGDDVLLHLLRVDDQGVPDEHCRLARDHHLRRRRPGHLVQVRGRLSMTSHNFLFLVTLLCTKTRIQTFFTTSP